MDQDKIRWTAKIEKKKKKIAVEKKKKKGEEAALMFKCSYFNLINELMRREYWI